MPKSKIPSPARSHGGAVTPRRYKSRGPRSVGSPARSDISGRLTTVIKMHKTSFVMSPMPTRRSVLADNTDIEEPKRRSWWRQLEENSRDVMDVIESNKVSETDNIEELIEMDVLSQENKDYHLDLPESSGSESIHSIVMPQRKLFKQKENDAQRKFGQIVSNRETLPKLHKSGDGHDKSIKVGTRELFQSNKQRAKPIFPAALLDISLNKTVADKTKENLMEPPKNQVRNIFGNRAPTKRRNMFAEFVVSESEDEIPEIQPKVFGFPKKLDPKRRGSSTSRGMREPSPASSITTDMEMDDWRQLPSSTMVAEQLEEAMSGTPVKRARLSKLSEVKESDTGTNSNATSDKTKQSNKSVSSKNISTNSSKKKDKSLEINRSMTTRHAARNMANDIVTANIADKTVHDASFTSKNISNNKSKNSNSILNKHNSKQNSKRISQMESTQQNKQHNIVASVIDQIENNEVIDENEENNFTLEYESDEHQEAVMQNMDNKTLKNKTLTLRRNSNKTQNDEASPKKQNQNTSISKLQPLSKKIVNETKEFDVLKESDNTAIDMETKGDKNNSEDVRSNKSIVNLCKPSTDNRNNVIENNDMEFDEDINDCENENVHHIESFDKLMNVDELDKGLEENKRILSESVHKSPDNIENGNRSQSNYRKESVNKRESRNKNRSSLGNKQASQNNVLINEDINEQNEHEKNYAGNSPGMLQETIESNKIETPGTRIEESIDNSKDINNKLQKLNKSKHENSNTSNVQSANKSNLTKQSQMDIEEKNENNTTEQKESEDDGYNGSKIVRQDKSNAEDPNASEILADNDNIIKKQIGSTIDRSSESQHDIEMEEHNESEMRDAHHDSELEEDKQNEADEQNGSEVVEHDISGAEQRNETEVEEQNQSKLNKHDENETEKQEEADGENQFENEREEQNESKDEEPNESEVEEQNQSGPVEQNENEVEDQNESEVEEQNESKIEQQNETEVEEQNESEVEEQNESEVEEQNESKVEEQNESEVEEQNESEVEEQNESEVEEQSESEVEEQNESEVEEQSESEVEEQNESEVEEQNESEVEEQNESEAEEQNESKVEEQNESEVEEENESEDEEDNGNEEESENQNQEGSEDVIERTETPNSSGIKSPEIVLHDKSNRDDSIIAKGRNTSVRKSKSMIQPLNIRPSLAPPRDSIGFSDGTKNSTTEGSGWDSHRTTRKTLRQTLGRDFSPRKSLRALVMEKSAKRHTTYMDGRPDITSLPQANSTEFPDMSNRDYEETMESDHELSRRTRQATLEMCLEQIKKKNLERWEKVGEQVRNMFKTSNKENVRFKEPRPMFESIRKTKQVKAKSKDKQLGSLMPLDYLPSELLEDMKYKPPKRFQPRNVSWITKRLYKFLETKLEPKYDYKARVRAEKLVETIYNFAKGLKRHQVAPTDAVDVLKHEMARLDIVKTHFEFYEFFKDYMPREIRIKVIPDIVNKIPMPRHGIFSEILPH